MISAFYVARGRPAFHEACASINSLRQFHDIGVTLLTDHPDEAWRSIVPITGLMVKSLYECVPDCDPGGRLAKMRLLEFADPAADRVLYLDADTRIISPLPLDALLGPKVGYDLAITPSAAQGADAMWHIGAEERAQTLIELGDPAPLCYNAGVFLMTRNQQTQAFCRAWVDEWWRWQDQDQAAFLRALHRVPLKLWLLGREFNGGQIIAHRFGMAKDEKTR